jgi:glycerophosphoryl diester phosphodiesterase
MVEAAHAAEVPVHVWTVNDTSEMSRLLDLGVDGLMSDDAVGLRQTFVDHGIWSSHAGD